MILILGQVGAGFKRPQVFNLLRFITNDNPRTKVAHYSPMNYRWAISPLDLLSA
jgi:hypothetical protein